MPSPLSYNPLADQLVISTFEYEVIGLDFTPMLSQSTNQLIPRWECCLNDRIQQLESGRFFAADSNKDGEVMVVLPRQLLWLNSSG